MLKLHDAAFYAAIFFILGVALASLAGDVSYKWLFLVAGTLMAFTFIWVLNKNVIAVFTLFLFVGGAYYFAYDFWQTSNNLIFNQKVLVRGVITKVSSGETGQQIQVGSVRAYLKTYPNYEYGDLVEIVGEIKPPQDKAKNYLSKEGVAGIMIFPSTQVLAKNKGNFIMASLNKLKLAIVGNLNKVLPQEKANFMAGLLVGGRSSFSSDFRDMLSRSGTSHLVALSGYNIAVLASGVALIISYFLVQETLVFILTLVILILFVAMTGAEASVVRAALVGMVMLLSNYVERQYSLRNTLSIIAALMVLQNPKILIFDIGFQLSFAALLGIIYLEPIISKHLHLNSKSFFNWRKNLATTLVAQIAVLPIVATSFGSISFSGIISNVFILGLVPITMFMGFMAAITGSVSYYISLVFGLVANVLLSYMVFVIKIFSSFGYLNGLEFGFWFMVVYYVVLVGGFLYYHKKYEASQ